MKNTSNLKIVIVIRISTDDNVINSSQRQHLVISWDISYLTYLSTLVKKKVNLE